ncbi:MAG: hypothetical protein E7400_05275 [Ruminococcaceae bacterium]|nr:hypothetical protein [Oscillospiraceae bacterium]
MITKKEIQYDGYGKCLEISNGIVRVVVTTDFGPRIIRYSFIDGENMFYENKDRSFGASGEDFDKAYGEGSAWYIYGGHRLWTSPEIRPRTYYPDNDPVAVKLTENGAIFTPPMQKWNQYQYTFDVSLAEDSTKVTVKHSLTNHGAWDVTLALWPITVLSPGGTEIVPQPVRKTDCLPNRNMAFWDYVQMDDSRLTWLKKYILLKQDCAATCNIKFGINSQHGYAMYCNHGEMFLKQFEPNLEGNYPDGGMSFETYTNPMFLEMETLGELQTVAPDATISHTETWSLYKAEMPELSDEGLDAFTKKYIEE